MQRRKMLLAGIVVLSFITAACTKSDTAGDTAAASTATVATTDHSADAQAIIALDSGWIRNVMAKNVDSLMTYYTADAVSYGFTGGGMASGTDQLRTAYTEMVKATMTDPKINPGPVNFSADGTMAFDHGNYSVTVTPPGGKATTESAAYLNVWKKVDGQWKLAAEMSTPFTAR